MSDDVKPVDDEEEKDRAKLIQRARDLHEDDDHEIDDDAKTSRGVDPGAWVQGWFWVPDEDIEPDEEE